MAPFTAAENDALLEDLAGATVTKGTTTVPGDFREVSVEVLQGEGRAGAVLTATASVRVRAGGLPGITTRTGIDEVIRITGNGYVDKPFAIVGIGAPDDEPFGTIVELFLKRL